MNVVITPNLARAIVGAESVMYWEGIDGMPNEMPDDERAAIQKEWARLVMRCNVLLEPGLWCTCQHHARYHENGLCTAVPDWHPDVCQCQKFTAIL